MPSQIMGYYNARKEKLLKDFDRTSALIKNSLVARYGQEFASTLQREVRQEYEKLIPEIPYIKGLRARALNTFLLISVQELAVYKAMMKHGKPPGEVWELCHEALRFRLAEVPQWKRWLLRRFMFSRLVRKIVARRARQKQKGRFGDFEIEYLIGDGDEFDFGVNYLQCGNITLVKGHGGEEFAPYVCMSDIALPWDGALSVQKRLPMAVPIAISGLRKERQRRFPRKRLKCKKRLKEYARRRPNKALQRTAERRR